MSYNNKLLEINLTNGKNSIRTLDEELKLNYIGGRGLGSRLIFDYLKPETDPLSEDNVILILTGPLTGTSAPSMRTVLVTKSPATNTFCASYIGGHIGSEIKAAGYDGIIVRGKSDKPVYININDNKVEIKDATDLWGNDTFETEDTLRKINSQSRVLCIGPAGEKLVKFALVNTEYFRHAGRGGIGAVFGSKNLKAVVVKGSQMADIAYPDEFAKLTKELWHDLGHLESTYRFRRWGTLGSVLGSSDSSTFPYKNFQEETFPEAQKISGELAERVFYVKKRACIACPIHCGHLGIIKSGPYKGGVVEGPEYETAAMLGGSCSVNDIYGLAFLNMTCDRLGLDTISAGGVLAFAMECYEKGMLSQKEMDGIDLKWGNVDGMQKILHKIALREGIGNIFAEGTESAASIIGGGASKYAMNVKGLEIPGWTIHSVPGMSICYATADRGADHQQANTAGYEIKGAKGPDGKAISRYSPVGKAYFVKNDQDAIAASNCMIVCDFANGNIGTERLLELYKYATGIEMDIKTYHEVGERSFNLSRIFNAREGFSRKHDIIPDRFFEEALTIGISAGQKIDREDFEYMLDDYYNLRGWDIKTGLPNEDTLKRLGISQFIK